MEKVVGGKVEETASTSNVQRASVVSMIAFGFLICLDFKLTNWNDRFLN